MPYVDPNTVHNPATGTVAPASWGDVIRDNFEFLIDPPACSVSNSTAQSLADNTLTVLNANTESFDNNSMHSTVTNNSRVTAQTAGRYLLTAVVAFAANNAGYRSVGFQVNGTTGLPGIRSHPVQGGINTDMAHTLTVVLAASDYVEAQALHQGTGGNLNVTLIQFNVLYLTR